MKSNGKRLLWVYEKGHEPRCSVPEAEAYQKDFYSFDKNGTRNVDTERWSAQLEKRIAQLITELVSSKREPAGAEKTHSPRPIPLQSSTCGSSDLLALYQEIRSHRKSDPKSTRHYQSLRGHEFIGRAGAVTTFQTRAAIE